MASASHHRHTSLIFQPFMQTYTNFCLSLLLHLFVFFLPSIPAHFTTQPLLFLPHSHNTLHRTASALPATLTQHTSPHSLCSSCHTHTTHFTAQPLLFLPHSHNTLHHTASALPAPSCRCVLCAARCGGAAACGVRVRAVRCGCAPPPPTRRRTRTRTQRTPTRTRTRLLRVRTRPTPRTPRHRKGRRGRRGRRRGDPHTPTPRTRRSRTQRTDAGSSALPTRYAVLSVSHTHTHTHCPHTLTLHSLSSPPTNQSSLSSHTHTLSIPFHLLQQINRLCPHTPPRQQGRPSSPSTSSRTTSSSRSRRRGTEKGSEERKRLNSPMRAKTKLQ